MTYFTDRMIDGMLDRIISVVNPSVIFNLWPGDRLSSPLLPFLLLFYAFFSATNNRHPPLNLNIIQPPITYLVTITLGLLVFIFWFKFYWGFFALSKQIHPVFLFENNFSMLIFFYFCSIYILSGCLLIL
jgi:hypothetical protein